jgi:hypothetical protein
MIHLMRSIFPTLFILFDLIVLTLFDKVVTDLVQSHLYIYPVFRAVLWADCVADWW